MVSLHNLCVKVPIQTYVALALFALTLILLIFVFVRAYFRAGNNGKPKKEKERPASVVVKTKDRKNGGYPVAAPQYSWNVHYHVYPPMMYSYPTPVSAAYTQPVKSTGAPAVAALPAAKTARPASAAPAVAALPAAKTVRPASAAPAVAALPAAKTARPVPAKGAAASQDTGFYSGKDEFLRSLTKAEYYEFVGLFIDGKKKPIEELPDYVIGERNADFFSKFFLYLYRTRSRISDNLIGKIYAHAVKWKLVTVYWGN